MGILNGPFIRSRKLRVRGGREVDLGFGAVVEVVRKDAQSHVRHDFVNLTVALTGPTHVVHIGICDSPTLIDQLASKGQCFCAFVVRCQAMPSLSQFCHTQADLLADSRVGGDAVATFVGLADGEGNLLPQVSRQRTTARCHPAVRPIRPVGRDDSLPLRQPRCRRGAHSYRCNGPGAACRRQSGS